MEYRGCYPRVQNLGYLSSNILCLQRSKYQIQKKEVRQHLSHRCSHVVFQEIFATGATQGLSQKSKTAWINNQAHTKACRSFSLPGNYILSNQAIARPIMVNYYINSYPNFRV